MKQNDKIFYPYTTEKYKIFIDEALKDYLGEEK